MQFTDISTGVYFLTILQGGPKIWHTFGTPYNFIKY